MKRLALVFLAACASAPPPDVASVKKAEPPARPPPLVTPEREIRAAIEYVTVPYAWVEKTMPVAPSDAKAWAEVRENGLSIETRVHVLFVTGDDKAAKAKMDVRLARLAKKEDLAKIEKDNDAGEPAEAVRAATKTLAPGEATPAPIKVEKGLLWVKKEAANEDQIGAAYRKTKAPELAKKLADEIAAKLKSGDAARSAIADAVTSVLGENASADAARPHAITVEEARLDGVRLPDDAKEQLKTFAKSARPGQVLEPVIATHLALVVARGASGMR